MPSDDERPALGGAGEGTAGSEPTPPDSKSESKQPATQAQSATASNVAKKNINTPSPLFGRALHTIEESPLSGMGKLPPTSSSPLRSPLSARKRGHLPTSSPLSSPLSMRTRLVPSSPLATHHVTPTAKVRLVLSKYIQEIRYEAPTEHWGELNALDTEVRNHESVDGARILMDMSKVEMEAFDRKLQEAEPGLSKDRREAISSMSKAVTMKLAETLVDIYEHEEKVLEDISEKFLEVADRIANEQEEAAREAEESQNRSATFSELRREHLMRMRKDKLVKMFMERDEARKKVTDFEREAVDEIEDKYAKSSARVYALEKKLIDSEQASWRKMMDRIRNLEEAHKKELEELQSRLLRQRADLVSVQPQASRTLQSPQPPPPPQIEPNLALKPKEGPEAVAAAVAAAANKAADAAKRRAARKEVQETLSNLDKMLQTSREFVKRHAGVGSSGPPSERTRLSIASSSSSFKNNPIRSHTSDYGAHMPKIGLGTLQDELDFESLPSKGSFADAGPSSGSIRAAYGTQPSPMQQDQGTSMSEDFLEEVARDAIGNPTPSTLTLNILARFVGLSSLAPYKISMLVHKLVQTGKLDENSPFIEPSLRRLKETAEQMLMERPILTEMQLERALLSDVEDWIFDLEVYLDRLIELLVDRTEDLTRAVADDEKLQKRRRRQQEKAVAAAETEAEADEGKVEEESGEKKEEERQDQKHAEDSTTERADTNVRESISSRGSGSASNERKLRFADRERQPSRQKHPRPAQLDLSRAGPTVSGDVAKRPLTPHPSTTERKDDSPGDQPLRPSPLKKSRAVSPVPEVLHQEALPVPNVPRPAIVQAAPTSPPAPALWRQLLFLLYKLVRWFTWGQLFNLWTMSAFTPLLLKHCWYAFQHELASGILTPDLRRRSLRPLQAPKIPAGAASSLCLWLLLVWNAAMLVSMKEERRLWLAANPRTAGYLRGLSSRYPYPKWSPFEVDYALLEPAWAGFSVWLHELYFRNNPTASAEGYDTGHAPAVMTSGLSYLAQGAKVTLMQVGIERSQDIPRMM